MRDNHTGGMPREPGEVLCGREIDAGFLVQLYRVMGRIQLSLMWRKLWNDDIAKDFGAISIMLNSIPHLRFHDLPRFTVDRINVNLNARKAFVSNAMPLLRFKQTLFRNHVNTLKFEQISQIVQAVIQATTDIAFRFQHFITNYSPDDCTSAHTIQPIAHDFANELFNLKSYANTELSIIHADFHSTPSKIYFFEILHFKLVNILTPSTQSYVDVRHVPLFNFRK
jgi:hypothetical protein